MPPEESAEQPSPEASSPATEAPAPTIEPVATPEAPSAPAEVAPAPQTAQIPPNEPISPPSSAAPVPVAQTHSIRDLFARARVSIQDRKRKKRDKIMTLLNTKTKITNDEVEKLLHVSDATATRYLSALEKEGKIIQVGKKGKGVLYIKTP